MAQYLGQQLLHLDIRPKRAAFLFQTNSAAQFRKAVERASSRWGGLQEPIIPTSRAGRIQPAWCQIAEVLRPDIAFHVGDLDADACRRASAQLGIPVHSLEVEDHPSSGAHPLVVEHTAGVLLASSSTSPCAFAGPGLLASWNSADEWEKQGVTISTSDDDVESANNQLRGTTVMEATGAQCSELSATGMPGPFALLWIAERSSLKDAVWFWNMRCLMPRGFEPPRAALVTPSAAAHPSVAGSLDHFKGVRKWTSPDLLVLSLTLERKRLHELVERAGIELLESNRISYHLGRQRDIEHRLTAWINADPRDFWLDERDAGSRSTSVVTVEAPKTVARATSPVAFSQGGGRVRVRLSGPLLRVPHRDTVAGLFLANASWKGGGLEIETDPMAVYHFELLVPSADAILREAVAATGLRFELSQPGRLAGAVASLIRSGQRPFANPNMRAVVSALTTKRSKTLAREIVELSTEITGVAAAVIADRVGPQLTQVARSVRGVASIGAVAVTEAAALLERLVRLGLAERGLLVLCDQCHLSPFVALQATTPAGTCPACKADVEYVTNRAGELQVHYRLNALLDRASDQGVVAHLAVLDQMAPDPETSLFLLGAQVFNGSTDLGEVDLLGYDGDKLVCGEVKTSPGGLTPHEIVKTLDIAKAMQADLVVFGCTSDLPQALLESVFSKADEYGLRAQAVDPQGIHVPERRPAERPPMA
jgi:hypothetical protein